MSDANADAKVAIREHEYQARLRMHAAEADLRQHLLRARGSLDAVQQIADDRTYIVGMDGLSPSLLEIPHAIEALKVARESHRDALRLAERCGVEPEIDD
jgi:hypothetical protein